jgi:hypothetical protein
MFSSKIGDMLWLFTLHNLSMNLSRHLPLVSTQKDKYIC